MSLLLALALLAWLSCASIAGTADSSPPPPRIWSGLILATNNGHPGQPPGCLGKYTAKLRNIFGYNQFELIGEYSEKMDDPTERWLIPSKDFCLSVKTHNAPGEHYPMKIALFQNRRRLAEFETHLSADSPLFIRGPLYAGGQLVIVLHVVDPSDIPAPREIRPPIAAALPKEKSRQPPPSAPIATNPRQGINPTPLIHVGPGSAPPPPPPEHLAVPPPPPSISAPSPAISTLNRAGHDSLLT